MVYKGVCARRQYLVAKIFASDTIKYTRTFRANNKDITGQSHRHHGRIA